MPNPSLTVGGGVNPFSTYSVPRLSIKAETIPWSKFTGLIASQNAGVYVLGDPGTDLEPAFYKVAVDGVAEYGEFYHAGGSTAVTKVAGSTNVVAGASPGATQISLNNNSGSLEIRTGSGTLVGTTVSIKRIA